MLPPVPKNNNLVVSGVWITNHGQALVVRNQQTGYTFVAQQCQGNDINQQTASDEFGCCGFQEFGFQPALIAESVVVVRGIKEEQGDQLVGQCAGLPGCAQDAVHILLGDLGARWREFNTPTGATHCPG